MVGLFPPKIMDIMDSMKYQDIAPIRKLKPAHHETFHRDSVQISDNPVLTMRFPDV